MKSVLISIRPKWCQKIISGEKTIEVRKTRPRLNPPFKCYIYCTKAKARLVGVLRDGDENYGEIYHGKPFFIKTDDGSACDAWGKRRTVFGEFICDRIYEIRKRGTPENFDYCYLSLNEWGNDDIEAEIKAISASCVEKEELNVYGASTPVLYGWHISSLKIYDTPRELSEFTGLRETRFGAEPVSIKRPPQSWCYVAERTMYDVSLRSFGKTVFLHEAAEKALAEMEGKKDG